MNKKDKVLNIVAIRKYIFKSFSWIIPLKLEIVYYMIKTLNSLMFGTMNWDLKYLMTNKNEVFEYVLLLDEQLFKTLHRKYEVQTEIVCHLDKT